MENTPPKERFLAFLLNCNHTGAATANALLEFLDCHNKHVTTALHEIKMTRNRRTWLKMKLAVLMRRCANWKLHCTIHSGMTFWKGSIYSTNHNLQCPKIVLLSAVIALKSRKTFVMSKRDILDEYEDAGKRISGTSECAQVSPHQNKCAPEPIGLRSGTGGPADIQREVLHRKLHSRCQSVSCILDRANICL